MCLRSVHEGCEQGSPPRLWCSDGRLSRSCSSENQHTSSLLGGCVGGGGSDWPKKEAEENKENVRLDQCFSNTSGLPTDLDGWNESVISGGSRHLKVWFAAHLDIFQISSALKWLKSLSVSELSKNCRDCHKNNFPREQAALSLPQKTMFLF